MRIRAAAPGKIPFFPNKEYWGRPGFSPWRPAEAFTPNLLLNLLAVQYVLGPPTVTGQRLWIPRRENITDPNCLLTLLAQTSAMPFVPEEDDWPRSTFTPARFSEATQNLLLTTLPTTLPPFVENNDNWARQQYVYTRTADATQNLLLTTLAAPVVATPFEPTDWSRRTGLLWRRYEADQAAPQSLLSTTLAPFKTLADWPAPPLVARRASEAFQNLLTTTLSIIPGTPFIPLEWGKPASPSLVRQSEAVQNLLTTLLPTTLAPLVNDNDDWGERYQPTAMRVSESSQNPLVGVLGLVPQPMPFQPEEADGLRTQWVPYRVVEATQNLVLTVLPTTQSPLKSADWSQPSITRRPPPVEACINLLLATAQANRPFMPIAWPRAAGPVSTDRVKDCSPNLLLTLLPTSVQPTVKMILMTAATGSLPTMTLQGGSRPTLQRPEGML